MAVLAGDYAKVVTETEKALSDLSDADKHMIWETTPKQFYKLDI